MYQVYLIGGACRCPWSKQTTLPGLATLMTPNLQHGIFCQGLLR